MNCKKCKMIKDIEQFKLRRNGSFYKTCINCLKPKRPNNNENNQAINNEINQPINKSILPEDIKIYHKPKDIFDNLDKILNNYGYLNILPSDDLLYALEIANEPIMNFLINKKMALVIPEDNKVILPIESHKLVFINTLNINMFNRYMNKTIYNIKTNCNICFNKAYHFKTCSRCKNEICYNCNIEIYNNHKQYGCTFCRYSLEDHFRSNNIEIFEIHNNE